MGKLTHSLPPFFCTEDEALAAAMIAHKDAKDRYDILAKAAAKAEVSSGKKRGSGGGGEEEEEEGGDTRPARYVFTSLRSPPWIHLNPLISTTPTSSAALPKSPPWAAAPSPSPGSPWS